MSKYAVYELFNGCEAPSNISTFGGYLAGVKVGTSDKNPLNISDTTHHTSEPVRCKDCERFAVDQSDHDYRTGWWCKRWYTDMVKPDGFCAWAEKRED